MLNRVSSSVGEFLGIEGQQDSLDEASSVTHTVYPGSRATQGEVKVEASIARGTTSLEQQLKLQAQQLEQQAKVIKMLVQSQLGDEAHVEARAGQESDRQSAVLGDMVLKLEEAKIAANMSRDVAENMFSYAMRVVPAHNVELAHRLIALFILLLSVTWQVVFAFGFLDASMLLYAVSDFDGFKDVVDLSVFYPDTVLIHGATAVPKVTLLCSLAAILLMCFYMRDDNIGTLLAPNPIDLLVWNEGLHQGRDYMLWLVLVAVPLQLLWGTRAVVLPVLAGAGSAYIYANCIDAKDVVFDAVAIAYVFDLDRLAYNWLVSARERVVFQKAQRDEMLRCELGRHSHLCFGITATVFIIDALSMLTIYLIAAMDFDMWGRIDDVDGFHLAPAGARVLVRNYLFVRAGAMGLGSVLVSLFKRRERFRLKSLIAEPRRFVGGLLRLLLQAALAVAQLFMLWAFVHSVLYGSLGFRPEALSTDNITIYENGRVAAHGVSIMECVGDAVDVGCENIHENEETFSKLRAYVCDENDACPCELAFFTSINDPCRSSSKAQAPSQSPGTMLGPPSSASPRLPPTLGPLRAPPSAPSGLGNGN